jgi:hypothetical protein
VRWRGLENEERRGGGGRETEERGGGRGWEGLGLLVEVREGEGKGYLGSEFLVQFKSLDLPVQFLNEHVVLLEGYTKI